MSSPPPPRISKYLEAVPRNRLNAVSQKRRLVRRFKCYVITILNVNSDTIAVRKEISVFQRRPTVRYQPKEEHLTTKTMGKGQSKQQQQPPTPPPRHIFKDEPWRILKGWDKSTRDNLKSEIQSLRQDTSLHVQKFNIILMGEVGSGKSSFFNSINGIFKEGIVPGKAEVGLTGRSLTKEFMMYDLGKSIHIRIGDTMGVQKDTSEADIRNILSVVDGHVPNGYKFTPQEEFTCGSPGYIPKADIADKAHCVAIVINAKECHNMIENMIRKIRSLAEGLWARKVPFFILLTHLDTYCPEVRNDVTKTFHIIPLETLVDKVSKIVLGLPKNQIFPVINYQEDVDLDDNKDILLLYPLRAMVRAAQAHLENIESLANQPSNSTNLQYVQQEMGSKELSKPLENEEMPTEL